MGIRQMLMMFEVNIKINEIMRKFKVIINFTYGYYMNIIPG